MCILIVNLHNILQSSFVMLNMSRKKSLELKKLSMCHEEKCFEKLCKILKIIICFHEEKCSKKICKIVPLSLGLYIFFLLLWVCLTSSYCGVVVELFLWVNISK
jgi:predicted transcriptional regulator